MNRNPSLFPQCQWIQTANLICAIAHIDDIAIIRQSPAFTSIAETPQFAKARLVVYKSEMRLPCELKYVLVDHGNASSEDFRRKMNCSQDLAGLQSLLAER